MKYNPDIHKRKSIRFKGFDYAQEGLYFITICCKERACLFGEIINGEMKLNVLGRVAEECWQNIPKHFGNVRLHLFVIMPNHLHGIIEITENLGVGANQYSPNNDERNRAKDISPLRSPSKTIGSVIRGFKIGVTKWARQNTNIQEIWQRNYHDRIIRNDEEYYKIHQYIENNSALWEQDCFYWCDPHGDNSFC